MRGVGFSHCKPYLSRLPPATSRPATTIGCSRFRKVSCCFGLCTSFFRVFRCCRTGLFLLGHFHVPDRSPKRTPFPDSYDPSFFLNCRFGEDPTPHPSARLFGLDTVATGVFPSPVLGLARSTHPPAPPAPNSRYPRPPKCCSLQRGLFLGGDYPPPFSE